MALPTFKARIKNDPHALSGRGSCRVEVIIEAWVGTDYSRGIPFLFDTGAEATTITVALARELGLSTVGGRAVTLRGSTGTERGLLVPFRFRFAAWPDLEVVDSVCVIAPGEKARGFLGFRDIHPGLDFFKLGDDLFFVPPPAP
jgi:hypothetical protein